MFIIWHIKKGAYEHINYMAFRIYYSNCSYDNSDILPYLKHSFEEGASNGMELRNYVPYIVPDSTIPLATDCSVVEAESPQALGLEQSVPTVSLR